MLLHVQLVIIVHQKEIMLCTHEISTLVQLVLGHPGRYRFTNLIVYSALLDIIVIQLVLPTLLD